ncbi:MAG TPA: hypothetical protein VLB86_16425 [Gaiellaceae bacterium]|nr:hypothetical protein [Gaiellaceae bacterium]
MDEPGSPNGDRSLKDLAERFALALVGAVALSGERAERLAEELVDAGGTKAGDARAAFRDLTGRLRGDGEAAHRLARLFHELGLVTREEWDELDLRVAQLEHRVRLLEDGPRPARHETPPPAP